MVKNKKIIYLIFVILIISLSIFGCDNAKVEKNKVENDKAVNQIDENIVNYSISSNIKGAAKKKIEYYQSKVNNNPNDIESREKLAIGHFELAMYYFNQYNLGPIRVELNLKAKKQFINAIKHFEIVIENKPNDAAALVDLANSYFFVNRIDDAIKTDKKALAVAPNLNPPKLAYAYHLGDGKKEYKQALQLLREIPKTDPGAFEQAQILIKEYEKIK